MVVVVGKRERQGLKYNDCVALLMENRSEFIIWWLGLTKIGVKIAFINTNLRYALARVQACRPQAKVLKMQSARAFSGWRAHARPQWQGPHALPFDCADELDRVRKRAG